jgi:hypothetical protein
MVEKLPSKTLVIARYSSEASSARSRMWVIYEGGWKYECGRNPRKN